MPLHVSNPIYTKTLYNLILKKNSVFVELHFFFVLSVSLIIYPIIIPAKRHDSNGTSGPCGDEVSACARAEVTDTAYFLHGPVGYILPVWLHMNVKALPAYGFEMWLRG